MWKCSVVIRMDMEEKVEEEGALEMATALAQEWREHIRPSRLCSLRGY